MERFLFLKTVHLQAHRPQADATLLPHADGELLQPMKAVRDPKTDFDLAIMEALVNRA